MVLEAKVAKVAVVKVRLNGIKPGLVSKLSINKSNRPFYNASKQLAASNCRRICQDLEVPTGVPLEVPMVVPMEVPLVVPTEVPLEVLAKVLTGVLEAPTEAPTEVLTEAHWPKPARMPPMPPQLYKLCCSV